MIEQCGQNWCLLGKITFANVVSERQAGQKLIAQHKVETVDLGSVQSSDSSILALLLAWKRFTRESGWTLHYINLPQNLLSLAKVCNLEHILE